MHEREWEPQVNGEMLLGKPGRAVPGTDTGTGRGLGPPGAGGIWASRASPFADSLDSAPVTHAQALAQKEAAGGKGALN